MQDKKLSETSGLSCYCFHLSVLSCLFCARKFMVLSLTYFLLWENFSQDSFLRSFKRAV